MSGKVESKTKNENVEKKEVKDSEKIVNNEKHEETKKVEEKNKNEKPKRKISIKIIVISIIIILCCLVLSTIFAIINMFGDKVIKGISIEEIDVSGFTARELEEKLNGLVEGSNEKKIILKYEDSETEITPANYNTQYEVKEAVDEAMACGRNGNIFANNFQIINTFFFKKNIEINGNIDREKLDEEIKRLNETLPGIMQNYSYYIEEEELIISKGVEGIQVDTEDLKRKIEDAIGDFTTDSVVIDIPVRQVKPDEIDIEKIHSEIYKEPENAYITYDPLTVHPNVDGVDFNITIEEAKELLKEEKEEYIIPLKIIKAEKTLTDLGKEAFPNVLGSYSTKFNAGNVNRTNNINLATRKINGTIVLPGETFSYNRTVGKRTIQAGFKEAGAYAGGKVIQEVGGGICQVSSTLYNAALYANLEIIERYNHYFETGYVPAGRDATVSWGGPDFKFRNNRTYPIRISAYSGNGTETIEIYGIKEDGDYEVIVSSRVVSYIEQQVKYEDDDTLNEGEEVVSQNGHGGCISEAYKTLKRNGETVSSTLLSRDRYNPLEKIIRRGTKPVEPEVVPEPVQEPPIEPQPEQTPEVPETPPEEQG